MSENQEEDRAQPVRRHDGLLGLALSWGLLFTFLYAAAFLHSLISKAVSVPRALEALGTWAFYYLGATQWLYLVPLMCGARRRGRPDFAQGLLLGGSLTVLLNGLCWKAGCRPPPQW